MSGPAQASPLRERMIFNVGARRSGTFWLQRIVTAHPTVAAVPSETHLLSHGIAPLVERFQHDRPDSTQVGKVYVERPRLIAELRRLCDTVFGGFLAPGQERVAERTPLHVLHLGLISEIYPDARFVHIIRDGRDVARSIVAQPWGPDTIQEAAREWRDAVTAGRAAQLPADRYLEVRYEELLERSEDEIERLYAWLGLPSSPDDLAHPIAESRRRRNVDQRGMRGVASEKWRKGLSKREVKAFDRAAGDLMLELGYGSEGNRA